MQYYVLGREFFVGICETSNEAGASVLAETFPEFPCTPIKVWFNCKIHGVERF